MERASPPYNILGNNFFQPFAEVYLADTVWHFRELQFLPLLEKVPLIALQVCSFARLLAVADLNHML